MQKYWFAFRIMSYRLYLEIDVHCTSYGKSNDERRGGQEVGLCCGMHTTLEISVTAQH